VEKIIDVLMVTYVYIADMCIKQKERYVRERGN